MAALPDLHGRVFLVTGANSGIGLATAEALGRAGARVHLGCRRAEAAAPVAEAIRAAGGSAEVLPMDLADLASVRAAADKLLAAGEPLHVLVNNAGIAGQRGATRDGFELAFGVNHLGHFLLTRLLLDRLRASAPARIVSVASKVHRDARSIDWEALRRSTPSLTGMSEYAVSKLANVLFTRELARRLDGSGVTAYALHPGVIASNIWSRVPWPIRPMMTAFLKSTEEGAQTSLHCATSPALAGESGRYYDESREKRPSALALDDALAAELWRRSEAWVAPHLESAAAAS
jgi:NAD(P)-dependent dehydrogenase (short-subunit alcohol dehydrogenase family)